MRAKASRSNMPSVSRRQGRAHGHHPRALQQVVEAVHGAALGDALRDRHGLGVDGDHLHAEGGGAHGQLAAGAAEADDAHALAVELDGGVADRPLVLPGAGAHGAGDAPAQGQQQGHGVLGEVDADEALGAGEDHVAGAQLRRQHAVDAGGRRLDPAQRSGAPELLRGEAAEDDLHRGRHLGAGLVRWRLQDLHAIDGADALHEIDFEIRGDEQLHSGSSLRPVDGRPAMYAARRRAARPL